jgi:multidrug transporter EmrE-like cation transporter
MAAYAALLMMVVLSTLGQVFIKKGAGRLVFGQGFAALVRSFFNLNVLLGSGFVVFAPLFYLFALTLVDLRVAFSFTGLNYVLVFLSGYWFFKERVTSLHVAGITVVVLGVVVFNL